MEDVNVKRENSNFRKYISIKNDEYANSELVLEHLSSNLSNMCILILVLKKELTPRITDINFHLERDKSTSKVTPVPKKVHKGCGCRTTHILDLGIEWK
jgi:hypothetical protein